MSSEGYAERSFVGDMSTGYSGNLGFTLPDNWAFDQIVEYPVVGSGTGAIGIDKDISSGFDPGQSSVDAAVTFPEYVTWVHDHAMIYRSNNPGSRQALLVAAIGLLAQNQPLATALRAVAAGVAVVVGIVAVATRLHAVVLPAVGQVIVVALLAVWLLFAGFLASPSLSPPQPRCPVEGMSGPAHFETVLVPPALWCVSNDGASRAAVTEPLTTLLMTAALVVLLCGSVALAVWAWPRRPEASG